MIADKPAAVPSAASRDSVIGSRGAMFTTATRPANFSTESNAPSGVDSFGNWTTMICSAMILLPIGMATFATATLFKFLVRSEEHTSELQSLAYLVCRLLLEKKKK